MKRLWPLAFVILPATVFFLFVSPRALLHKLFPPQIEEASPPRFIVWFLKRQNPDGSWGEGPATLRGRMIGKAGLTGLALLPILGAGYSHLSKDTHEGKCVGHAVRDGLKWLLRNQGEDGTFSSDGDPALDQALATFGLSEAYGMTASYLLKDPAQKAIDALAAMQREDGSWGDLQTTSWAGEAFKSAELAELSFPRKVYEGLLGYYEMRQADPPDPSEVYIRIFIEKRKAHPRIAPAAAAVAARPPDWDQQDFLYWYQGCLAVFQYDGPQGPLWKKWNGPLKETLVPSQHPRGCWPGKTPSETVVQTSLAALCLEIYYRYANAFGGAWYR